MEYFDAASFNKQFLTECQNEQECKTSLSVDPIAIPPLKQQPGQFAFI